MVEACRVDTDYVDSITDRGHSPEQLLLAAVVLSAIKDATSPRKLNCITPNGLNLIRIEATQWCLSDSMEPFSFLWCISHLTSDDNYMLLANKLRECLFVKKATAKLKVKGRRVVLPLGIYQKRGPYKKRKA